MLPALLGAIPGAISAGGALYDMFRPKKDPAAEANKYLSQIPGAVGQYYQPYMQAGNQTLQNLLGEYGNLMSNPGDVYNRLGAGYKESPGYQFALKQALGAGSNAAAAGGTLGTPMSQQAQMELAQNVASKDYENYLNHVLGLYGKGLAGEQGIETQGFNANTSYGNLLGNVLGAQAQNAFTGAANQNQAMSGNIGNLTGGLGQAFTGYNAGQQQATQNQLAQQQMQQQQDLLNYYQQHGLL